MSIILHIETATEICSVCVAEDGLLIGLAERKEKFSHASQLHVLIDELLKKLDLRYNQLDAIAVSMGPGSYTGLRIGVSAAKGFCFALDKPLIAINSLQAMTAFYKHTKPGLLLNDKSLFCPMIDARRMEVYTAMLNINLNFVSPTQALILTENAFSNLDAERDLYFFGDGSAKFQKLAGENINATFTENFSTSSIGLVNLAQSAYKSNDFKDIAYFEPYYLKDFYLAPPKK